jgi:hypothetical protein
MAESQRHKRLLNALLAYVLDTYLEGDEGLVFADDGIPGRTPPRIAGYTPDVYVPSGRRRGMIVGEAETARSLQCEHTIRQIQALMGACETTERSVFILAVPWDRVRLALSILRDLRRKGIAENVEALVLERLVV